MRVSVTFTPAETESLDFRGLRVVAIDCLRASTSIVAPLAAGAKAVYPFLRVDDARQDAKRRGALLAGERQGLRVEGFDLGNSPLEFTAKAVGGRDVVMSTTNGTRLLEAAQGAAEMLVAGFVNASVTADALASRDGDIVVGCAGTEGAFSVEDSLCAGLIVSLIGERRKDAREEDSAVFARLAWEGAADNLRGAVDAGRGAANVREIGLERDIDFALAVDAIPIVAMALENPLRIIRVERI